MYHIASSIRSKATRAALSFAIPTNATSLSSRVYPKYAQQATLSLSMFATGTTLNNSNFTTTSSSSNDQRRPFWATRPTEEEATKSSMINSVDHKVKTVAATAGLNADGTNDKKEKAPKKATTKKPKKSEATAAAANEDEDESLPTLKETDFMNTEYMAKVIAKKNDLSHTKAKRIVDSIFDMVIDVRFLLYVFYI
jgi:Ca2+-dependent lipid-binding protein